MDSPDRRVRGSVGALLVLLVGSFAGACSAQDGGELVRSSDPELAALAAGLLPDLARRSGMELRAPVRVEERSRADLVRYLEHKLDEELPDDEARAVVAAYALLGLVPDDLDLRAVLLALYTEQVAGFYEPDSTALFVLDDQSEEDLRGLLIHELVHAVQDQSVELDAITDPDLGADRATAAQAAIEGHATLVMFELMAEEQLGQPVDLSAVPGFGAILRQSLEMAPQQFAVLSSAPAILRETLIFPYLEGALYLQGVWAEGGRKVPFGDDLPRSTEEILTGPGTPEPVELALDVRGAAVVHDDVLGLLQLAILLEQHLGPDARALADGWDGDRYALVERPDGTRALLSAVVWNGVAARDRFADALDGALDGFGGVVRLERIEATGRPATLLTIGDGAGVDVRIRDARR